MLLPAEKDIADGRRDEFLATFLADKQMSDRITSQLQQSFLAKPSSQRVITALHQGASLRDAAAKASVPIEVARKVLAVRQKI